MRKISGLLIVAALTAVSSQTNATTLTFATTGATGVTGASGGPILDQNPSTTGNVLISGGIGGGPTPGYGSNVSASSASNGAYIVANAADATSTVSLTWSVSGGVALPSGTVQASLDGINTPNNGVLLLDSWGAGASFNVVFSDTNAGNKIALDSFELYRLANSLNAVRGHAYTVSVTGSASGLLFSDSVVIDSATAHSQLFNFGGSGVLGAIGEELTLTFTRPSTGELGLVQAAGLSAVDATTNRNAIDNLTFHTVASNSNALPEPSAALLLAAGLPLLRRRLSKTKA